MKKDRKQKLGAEKLEKREAPFMTITNQEEPESTGGTTQERTTVNREPAAEDPPIAQDEGPVRRTRYYRGDL